MEREQEYNVFTFIEGTKQYVRRIRRGRHVSVSMLTTNKLKAFCFSSEKSAEYFIKQIGIGYSSEKK